MDDYSSAALAEQPDVHAVRPEDGDLGIGVDDALLGALDGIGFADHRRADADDAAVAMAAADIRIVTQAIGNGEDIRRQLDRGVIALARHLIAMVVVRVMITVERRPLAAAPVVPVSLRCGRQQRGSGDEESENARAVGHAGAFTGSVHLNVVMAARIEPTLHV